MSALKSKEEKTMLNMFPEINLLHICNQAVWEEEGLCPGNETCSGSCCTLFSHDQELGHCTCMPDEGLTIFTYS